MTKRLFRADNPDAYDAHKRAAALENNQLLAREQMTPSPIPEDRKSSGGPDLSQLLSRVEEAQGRDRELDRALAIAVGDQVADDRIGGFIWRSAASGAWSEVPRLTSSLDAALALVERCLPGWCKSAVDLRPEPCEAYVWERGHAGNIQGKAATPALALLAALLKSLQAEPSEAATRLGYAPGGHND